MVLVDDVYRRVLVKPVLRSPLLRHAMQNAFVGILLLAFCILVVLVCPLS